MNFCKMHGLKNDFIVIENMQRQICLTTAQIAFLCNRKEGIGADGLILVEPSARADVRMKYFNSDGSAAQVCGNGLRCVAKYVFDEKLIPNRQMLIQSAEQDYEAEIVRLETDGKAKIVCVNMGKAVFESAKIPVAVTDATAMDIVVELAGQIIPLSAAGFPNPHAVLVAKAWEKEAIERIGGELQSHALFPQQVNVNFAIVKNRGEIELTTYERGVGITQACGSGACATSAVLHKKNVIDSSVKVKMPGGELAVRIADNGDVLMTGEAKTVFTGTIQ